MFINLCFSEIAGDFPSKTLPFRVKTCVMTPLAEKNIHGTKALTGIAVVGVCWQRPEVSSFDEPQAISMEEVPTGIPRLTGRFVCR